ncbi:SMD3 [Candida pseudojiufengensis]|uniref:SMD3 n=1 Tax=Candida pseudojiufengensis TaxID=497109 RepID=UPI002225060B|nr:SMD3 [Candida pseudojiufengensis]KAI5964301.1 SMD3 [Candida pseudojiufengensis]
MSASIPVRLLNEAQGHIISIELINGDTYRGKLLENEDNMNSSLYDVTITSGKNSSITHMDQVFIRGSMIRFISVPNILKNAPMFFMKPGDKPKPPIRGPPPKRRKM